MKAIKRIATFILALCLTVPGFSLVVNAAEGRVSFTDPQTKTGETVEVTCALRATVGALETFDITLKYDPEFLAFESGDEGVEKESDGVIKFSGKGNGTNRIGFTMKFQALKTGTTKVEVSDAAGFMTSGDTVDCKNGNSTIQIAQGTEPVTLPANETSVKVTVGDQEYSLSGAFKSSDIPVGFTEGTLSYDGAEHKIVQNETATVKLGYLVDSTGKGDFFVYNEEDATFSPYVSVTVSPTTSINLLKADDTLKVPSGYQEVKLTVNEHEFPAWQDSEHEGFYLVYAMNADGEKGFYQYDTEEESYQRFIAKDTEENEKKVAKESKLSGLIGDNRSIVVVGGGAAVLILLLIVLVLSIKLHRRNVELDDLYDELEAEDEDEDGVIRLEDERKEKRNQFKKQAKKEPTKKKDDFDDFEDYYEDDYDDDFEDDFEDDFDYEDDFKSSKKHLDNDDFDFGSDDFDSDDFNIDDFEVDFIDLD